jgi:FkbM family methyltransferase
MKALVSTLIPAYNAEQWLHDTFRSRIFRPLRRAYLRSVKRDYWNNCVVGPQQFYRQFVGKGSTVFDVGANVGERTETFLSLGADKVIAVEPTPDLARKLSHIPDKRLTVVESAAGKEAGVLPLNLSSFNTLNSFSTEWLDEVAQETPSGRPQWTNSVNVEVTTLDALIQQHGTPDFIKIDVEGYECEVLQGLTSCPRYLSFEFHSEQLDTAVSCLQQPCFSTEARFNYILGEPYGGTSLQLPEWKRAEDMIDIMRIALTAPKIYGDIFVRQEARRGSLEPIS